MDWGSCLDKTVDPTGVATLRCIPAVLSNVVDWAIGLAGLVAVFFIIFSGFKFLTSGGDPKQVEGARKTMTYAIAGLIIIFIAFALIKLIGTITGATCINTFGFDTCK
jgi:heme O synthase-like polyprenyltransferase